MRPVNILVILVFAVLSALPFGNGGSAVAINLTETPNEPTLQNETIPVADTPTPTPTGNCIIVPGVGIFCDPTATPIGNPTATDTPVFPTATPVPEGCTVIPGVGIICPTDTPPPGSTATSTATATPVLPTATPVPEGCTVIPGVGIICPTPEGTTTPATAQPTSTNTPDTGGVEFFLPVAAQN